MSFLREARVVRFSEDSMKTYGVPGGHASGCTVLEDWSNDYSIIVK